MLPPLEGAILTNVYCCGTQPDSHAHIPPRGMEGEASAYVELMSPEAIPEIYDIPIGIVNRRAYGKRLRPTDLPSA